MSDAHAPRREPAVPDLPLMLERAVEDLLATAASQSSGRAARALLPGSGGGLTQTLLALTADATMAEHVAPGPATLQVLRGEVLLRWQGEQLAVPAGGWAPVPEAQHDVHAVTDSACLLTVATR